MGAKKHWAVAINDYERYVAVVEIIGLAMFYVLGIATYDHYTWWSLALVWLHIVIVAAVGWSDATGKQSSAVRSELWLAPFLPALVVVLGVIVMSSLPCTLLTELYKENGPLVCTGGNFLAHYYPLIRMVFFAPTRIKAEKPLTFALNLILVHTLAFNPNSIYGCTALSRPMTTMLLAGIPFLTLAACICL